MASVCFKAHGKVVRFQTKTRRRHGSGKVPKHLKPFLFKAKKSRKKSSCCRGTWPKGKVPPHLKKYLFR
jgi:hypothetical protein